jgi:hypothetical protein
MPVKNCPVCGKPYQNDEAWCAQCAWELQSPPALGDFDEARRIYERRLATARSNWQKMSEAQRSAVQTQEATRQFQQQMSAALAEKRYETVAWLAEQWLRTHPGDIEAKKSLETARTELAGKSNPPKSRDTLSDEYQRAQNEGNTAKALEMLRELPVIEHKVFGLNDSEYKTSVRLQKGQYYVILLEFFGTSKFYKGSVVINGKSIYRSGIRDYTSYHGKIGLFRYSTAKDWNIHAFEWLGQGDPLWVELSSFIKHPKLSAPTFLDKLGDALHMQERIVLEVRLGLP